MSARVRSVRRAAGRWLGAVAVAAAVATVRADDRGPGVGQPLRVAVYDAAPYGFVGPDGLFGGASVDLWRRAAEDLHWRYELTAVPDMEDVLGGLERGTFDAAVGAITITPARLERVDFSYPTHRSGVAAAFARRTGPATVLAAYAAVAGQLGALVGVMVALLLTVGVLVWLFERGRDGAGESAIGTLHEGVYWAVVTMTTVGYGDKTPKTHAGRAVAVAWMLVSLALISLLSTSLVAQLTAERVAGTGDVRASDLAGRRIAAAAGSSGAEFLAGAGLPFDAYPSLDRALEALAAHRADAVVNSVGALDHAVSARFAGLVDLPRGLLAPALMGVALPPRSPLLRPLDRALVKITTSPEWAAVEASYLGSPH